MNSQLFLLINLAAAVFFIWWFWSGRASSKSKPALDLKRESKAQLLPSTPRKDSALPAETAPKKSRYSNTVFTNEESIAKAKKLNVLFIYNGHDWDAYEVLGVPAGCSLPLVTQRYQELIQGCDEGQLQFYEAAYTAILKKT